jgi:hypothetical protein
LGKALRDSERQVEIWKFVGQLWADEAWRHHILSANPEGAPPSPNSFTRTPLAPIVQALLGIYGRGALVWCINAFFTRTGQIAEGIVQVIIAGAFGDKAVIEAIGAALKEVQAERRPYPREIPAKVASLLSRTLSSTSISGRTKSEAKGGSLMLTRVQVATLVQALLPAKPPDDMAAVGNLASALAETAWMDADEALARALQQTPRLRKAIREPTELHPELRNHLGAIIQAVRASAAKRELEIEGDPGSEVAFDPVRHAQDDPRVRTAQRVRIVTPTVFQGRGAHRRVLRVAEVEPGAARPLADTSLLAFSTNSASLESIQEGGSLLRGFRAMTSDFLFI